MLFLKRKRTDCFTLKSIYHVAYVSHYRMTCEGCKVGEAALLEGGPPTEVSVDLEHGTATITMDQSISFGYPPEGLAFQISNFGASLRNILKTRKKRLQNPNGGQLRPLFLIFSAPFASAFLCITVLGLGRCPYWICGLVLIVFSFSSFDLKWSFRMYDPLAKILPLLRMGVLPLYWTGFGTAVPDAGWSEPGQGLPLWSWDQLLGSPSPFRQESHPLCRFGYGLEPAHDGKRRLSKTPLWLSWPYG